MSWNPFFLGLWSSKFVKNIEGDLKQNLLFLKVWKLIFWSKNFESSDWHIFPLIENECLDKKVPSPSITSKLHFTLHLSSPENSQGHLELRKQINLHSIFIFWKFIHPLFESTNRIFESQNTQKKKKKTFTQTNFRFNFKFTQNSTVEIPNFVFFILSSCSYQLAYDFVRFFFPLENRRESSFDVFRSKLWHVFIDVKQLPEPFDCPSFDNCVRIIHPKIHYLFFTCSTNLL